MGKVSWVLVAFLLLGAAAARAATYQANPSNYESILASLQPGDTLVLQAGDYPDGLDIDNLNGTASAWITVKGPDSGAPAVILADPGANRDTIQIYGSSYVAIENLTCDGQDIDGPFGVNTKGGVIHHIRVENCTFVGYGAHQQSVAISTKTTTWGWIVRRNTVLGAGTGMYFGNSDGSYPFIAGLIEYNYVDDPEGYCVQIKHQNSRPVIAGMPSGPQTTIIRHNVFIKSDRPSGDGDRPNLLVDGFPDSGDGSSDWYEIYGNFLYHNPREALLQITGRVSVHDNVFADGAYEAVFATNHNKVLKTAYLYNNTFYDTQRAIVFNSPAQQDDRIVGNLMFTRSGALSGSYRSANAVGNLSGSVLGALTMVANPSLLLGSMDFYPLPGQCEGAALDLSAFAGNVDYDRDFNGDTKAGFTFRGAYAGSGLNLGWQLDAAVKTSSSSPPPPPPPPDNTPPAGSVTINSGAATCSSLTVSLQLSATDSGAGASGMGAGAQMRFSNDGATWSTAQAYAATVASWNLSSFGGNASEGAKTVYARFKDAAGNWTSGSITAQIAYQAPAVPPTPPPVTGIGAGCSSAHGGSLLATYLLALPLLLLRRRQLARG